MAKPELLLMIGLPASGKSTAAKAWQADDPDGRIRVNYDELRVGMFGERWIWNKKEEAEMKAQARRIVTDALNAGLSVVVDNTNLNRFVRKRWADLANSLGAACIEEDISTPLEECIRRDRLRPAGQRVGQAVIDRMALEFGYLDWNECNCHDDPSKGIYNEGHRRCEAKRPIAIVDIDGTVANCEGRMKHIRNHCPQCGQFVTVDMCETCHIDSWTFKKNWPAFFAEVAEDTPIVRMVQLIYKLQPEFLIVFVSGRPISCGLTKVGIITEDWLLRVGIGPDRLFLKQDGDNRNAPEFKKNILDHLPVERVAYVFDDDDDCVRMYRSELKRRGSDAVVLQGGGS